eukprot:Nk52_evm15s233 gene=Nk52_evmTU15s233
MPMVSKSATGEGGASTSERPVREELLKQSFSTFMERHGLSQYTEQLETEGCSFPTDFVIAEEEDLLEICATVNMKITDRVNFMKAVKQLQRHNRRKERRERRRLRREQEVKRAKVAAGEMEESEFKNDLVNSFGVDPTDMGFEMSEGGDEEEGDEEDIIEAYSKRNGENVMNLPERSCSAEDERQKDNRTAEGPRRKKRRRAGGYKDAGADSDEDDNSDGSDYITWEESGPNVRRKQLIENNVGDVSQGIRDIYNVLKKYNTKEGQRVRTRGMRKHKSTKLSERTLCVLCGYAGLSKENMNATTLFGCEACVDSSLPEVADIGTGKGRKGKVKASSKKANEQTPKKCPVIGKFNSVPLCMGRKEGAKHSCFELWHMYEDVFDAPPTAHLVGI